MKTCSKCKVEKTPEEFSKNKSRKDGLQTQCKACKKAHYEANREKRLEYGRAYREANREDILEQKRAYYEANREDIRERQRAHYAANREKLAAQSRAYNRANREQVAEYRRAYYKASRNQFLVYGQERRARRRNAAGSATSQDIQNRLDAHGHKCIYCGSTEDLHLDHIKPLSQGGSNWPSNLAPACGSCNLSKHARWGQDLVSWGTERFGPDRVKSWPFLQK